MNEGRKLPGGTSDDRELMACPVPLSSFRSVSLSSVARTSLMMGGYEDMIGGDSVGTLYPQNPS